MGKPRTVNCRMSQNPKIATIFLPGIMGSIAPPCRMLCAIISLPASPNPTANMPHIFAIEFSSRRVSICSPAASLDLDFEKKPPDRFLKPPPPTRSRSSSSESDDKPNSASAELAKLLSALDDEPALRAAAPSDEVEGETLALHYELMWQQQANRYVMTSLLGRVRDCVDGEGKRFAETQGDLAQAAAYMSKVREVRRILKREKRDADQRLALERAAAAAAGSTRVGAQRRDADGNVIAPAHGMDCR